MFGVCVAYVWFRSGVRLVYVWFVLGLTCGSCLDRFGIMFGLCLAYGW